MWEGGNPVGANRSEEGKKRVVSHVPAPATMDSDGSHTESEGEGGRCVNVSMTCLLKSRDVVVKFGTFIGPGFMVCLPPLSYLQHTKKFSKIAVAYIDREIIPRILPQA